SSGFDDFVLSPYVPEELYTRIRALEWRRSEFATEERHKVAGIVVDKAGHEVSVNGRPVNLTAKEFALLAYLCERRGKVLSREHLLARVWGNRYDGGPRTVDIHVRRLRAKLGDALPLETLRGSGYKLRTPDAGSKSETAGVDEDEEQTPPPDCQDVGRLRRRPERHRAGGERGRRGPPCRWSGDSCRRSGHAHRRGKALPDRRVATA